MRVFVTGATGLIGRALAASLLEDGHEVLGLSRSPSAGHAPGVRPIAGDPAVMGPWMEQLDGCDACVNLAGEPVADGRWTEERKRRIRESRLLATLHVAAAIAERGPRVLVSGSAVGYYGSRGDEELTERSAAGGDFLADVCKHWEAAAEPARVRARVVLLRTGIVLARAGGALQRMVLPFKLFAGGPIGDGAFWQPWIHLEDEVRLIRWALEEERVSGPLNAAAPAPERNRDLAKAIGRAVGRPSLVPAPVVALRLALGEVADLVTASLRVIPRAALDGGFRFRYPEIGGALEDLLRR
jgi:uncharacterized protein (TIGR01777 family)